MNILFFYFFQLLLLYGSFWLPYKCGRKDIGIVVSIVIAVITMIFLFIQPSGIFVFIFFAVEFILFINLFYWALRYNELKKIANYFVVLVTICVFAFIYCFTFCCGWWGDNNLGNNFSLLEGDRTEDRIIVYCSGRDEINECCTGGTFIIPSYKYHMNDGNYSEYIIAAEYDDKWVIAKSYKIESKQNRYWILNKDLGNKIEKKKIINLESLLQEFVTGPLDSISFLKKSKEYGINLGFD